MISFDGWENNMLKNERISCSSRKLMIPFYKANFISVNNNATFLSRR